MRTMHATRGAVHRKQIKLQVPTFHCAIHRARFADLLAILSIVEGDAARAHVLVAGAAHDLKLVLLLTASINLRLVCLHPAQLSKAVP